MNELQALPDLPHASDEVVQLFAEPPRQLVRGLVYLLLALLLTAAAYVVFGRVNLLVSAPASLGPSGAVRPVMADAAGRLSRIMVREGDLVDAGQAVALLDTAAAGAQLERAREELRARERQLQEVLASQADAQQAAEARARYAQARADEIAARRAAEGSIVVAPISGQVTRVLARSASEAIQAGQPIAEIAPADAPLVFHARVENRDVGRVRIAQPAKIKVDAFPYLEYGTLDGTVRSVSLDASADPGGPPYYRVVVAPLARTPRAGKTIELRLGLTAKVEIVTGQKRIVQLFARGSGE